jgi:hypothetical protein
MVDSGGLGCASVRYGGSLCSILTEIDFSKCISTDIVHWGRAVIYANVIITLNHSCVRKLVNQVKQ